MGGPVKKNTLYEDLKLLYIWKVLDVNIFEFIDIIGSTSLSTSSLFFGGGGWGGDIFHTIGYEISRVEEKNCVNYY